ncbi:MAG: PD-(D/E)XK nuclease family protein, partial [Clostridiales bacterium]|nr:PD-(D/E)XK nuclease family protein [Clostridiales bacterium]
MANVYRLPLDFPRIPIYNVVMTEKVYESYPSALDALALNIKSRRFAFDEYHIVLTPDRYTQSVERALFSGGGAIDCEVLTFSRLLRRLTDDVKSLSREAAVMLVARAIDAVKDDLVYYSRAAKYNDFAREVYQTLIQISSSDVDIATIEAKGNTAAKIHDLALIKAVYDEKKADYGDASDRLAELIAAIPKSELIARSHVYAIGFADCTKLNARVLNTLKKHALSFARYEAKPPARMRESVEIFSAPDHITQYKEVATRIREYIDRPSDGVNDCKTERRKYSDISIICPSPRALSRILREYGIPFYTDEVTPLAETSPLDALACIYRLKKSSDGETLVSLCKNPYSGCDDDDAQKLQNYIASRGISFGVFDMDIDDEGAARAVARAKSLINAMTGSSFAEACEAVMDFAAFDGVWNALGVTETDKIAPIRALTALLRRYGSVGDERSENSDGGAFDRDATAFFGAARAVEVKSLPRERDRVTVTMPQTLRLTACKLLFVVDFNEGILPAMTSDSGLICDNEIKSMGGVIEPTVFQQNKRERAELKAVINNAQYAVCTYSTEGGARPAAFLDELAVHAIKYDYAEQSAVLRETDDARYIAKYACTESAAREIAARGVTKHAQSVELAVGARKHTAAEFKPTISLAKKRTLSASELTHWFTCPYKRFVSDAVGVKERRNSPLGAPDFGIIVHDFMQEIVNGGNYDCSCEAVELLIDRILAKKGIRVDEATRSRLIADAADYAAANVAAIEAGDYRPDRTEYSFTLKTPLGRDKSTEFFGIIDRLDVCGDKARIIDYKTGSKKFRVSECLNGCDMQLPLYAAAAEELGKNVTGMFYSTFSPRYDAKDTDGRLDGCMIKDVGVVSEYDKTLVDGARSRVVNAKFKISKNGTTEFSRPSDLLMEREDFDDLISRCVRTADNAADEIAGGYIARVPIEGACDKCAF